MWLFCALAVPSVRCLCRNHTNAITIAIRKTPHPTPTPMPAAALTLRPDDKGLDVEELDVEELNVEEPDVEELDVEELVVEVLPFVAVARAYVYVGVPVDGRYCIVTSFSGAGPGKTSSLGASQFVVPLS